MAAMLTLTPELILSLSHQSHLSLVRDLVIRLPGEKLQVSFQLENLRFRRLHRSAEVGP